MKAVSTLQSEGKTGKPRNMLVLIEQGFRHVVDMPAEICSGGNFGLQGGGYGSGRAGAIPRDEKAWA